MERADLKVVVAWVKVDEMVSETEGRRWRSEPEVVPEVAPEDGVLAGLGGAIIVVSRGTC